MTSVNSLDHKYTHCHGNIPKGHFMNKLQMYQKFVRQLETRFSNQRLVSRIHFHNITINLQKKVSRSFYLNFTFMSPNLSYAFDKLKEIAWLELALRSVSLLFSIDESDAT